MIYRICGRSGSGKTEYLLSVADEILSSGGECIILVPEQESLDYEKKVFTRFKSKANLKCEILNFERLPNRTYREYGNLATEYIDEGGRSILMSTALENIKNELSEYKNVYSDENFIKQAIKTVAALKSNNISVAMLSKASQISEKHTQNKLNDLKNILFEYDRLFKSGLSDSYDALAIYAENLKKMPFFKNKTVLIDSFYTYTGQEYKIIDEIASQCKNLYISFLYDKEDKSGLFDEIGKAYKKIGKKNMCSDIHMSQIFRTKSKSLLFLNENIWKNTKNKCDSDEKDVKIIETSSAFEECEAAAAEILRLAKEGMRFKEILITARNPDNYEGIIDTVLEKHGIKAFFSVKDELSVKPLITFLLSSVEAIVSDFSLPVMKKYIKSGYAGLSSKQADLLLRYADKWNIRGKTWISDNEWGMNPDGYIPIFTPYGEFVLGVVNQAKHIVSQSLSALYESLGKKTFTAAEAAKSLYTHMIANSCDVNLKLKAEKLRKSDSDDSAQKLLQLWKIVINIFNQLYLVLPEKELEAKRLLFLLNLMCSEYNVGAIPVSADSVTVGDASMIRANDTKAVILLGVNDGVFPAQVADNGIFTENELVELESNGILFADTKKSRQIQEKLFFYAAVSCASEKVILIYNSAKPSRGSVGILRIESLIKNVNKSKFGENTADYCFSPIAAAENINKINNAALIKRLDKLGYNYKKIAEQNPISDKSAQITPLFDKKMSISPSKLEKYTYCGFSYFGQYVLKLAQNKKAEFSNAEIGTYIHKVLEEFVSSHIVNNKFEKPSAEKIKQEVDNITEKYILSVCGTITEKSKRFLYILKRIKITLYKLVDNICRELENCGFVPFGFEVKLGENDIKCAEYKTESGLQIILRGTIDRIDILEKNGKKYIRVVDYKTGAKVYSKKAVENGLDLQMFLYLFAVCNSMENSVPAGVLYLPSKLNVCKTDTEMLAAEVEEAFDKQFKRNGLVINDENVLSEMEPQLIGKYIPALKNADGQFSLRSSIASIEEIGALSIGLENYIKKLAESMISGNMSVSPLKLNSDYNACKYCDLKSACRLSLEKCVSREKNENTINF